MEVKQRRKAKRTQFPAEHVRVLEGRWEAGLRDCRTDVHRAEIQALATELGYSTAVIKVVLIRLTAYCT
jgi:hypothetical protein